MTTVDLSVLREIVADYDAHPWPRTDMDRAAAAGGATGSMPEQIARELLQRREAEEHHWAGSHHPAGDDTICTRCGADPEGDEDTRPCPGGDVDRDHHTRVARSRRRWIDAATSVLGPDWNGGPDELRVALSALVLDPDAPAATRARAAATLRKRTSLPAYKCEGCDASGVKLWRDYQTFLENQRLLCLRCALLDQHRELGDDGVYPNGDQISWMVPAVPNTENDTYWGYTSVPQKRIDWWHALPLTSTKER